MKRTIAQIETDLRVAKHDLHILQEQQIDIKESIAELEDELAGQADEIEEADEAVAELQEELDAALEDERYGEPEGERDPLEPVDQLTALGMAR